MKASSPLRYPGGKSAMAGLLSQIQKLNGLENRTISEPFAGGAGASLKLLYSEEVPDIHINDADSAIYSFWRTLTKRPQPFLDLLEKTPVNMKEWRHQREVYKSSCSRTSLLKLGFSAFYLNRCNHSGIIMNGGPIGGILQQGKWKINARFNKPTLLQRCKKIIEYRSRINVSGDDGIKLLNRLTPESTLFFIDPPYFKKGPTLYLNALDKNYHAKLASKLKSMSDAAWVLTYDNCSEIRKIYNGWANIHPFSLRYVAANRRNGREILITPKWMKLPKIQKSTVITCG